MTAFEEKVLLRYSAYLDIQGLAPSTVKNYLAAIRAWVILGLPVTKAWTEEKTKSLQESFAAHKDGKNRWGTIAEELKKLGHACTAEKCWLKVRQLEKRCQSSKSKGNVWVSQDLKGSFEAAFQEETQQPELLETSIDKNCSNSNYINYDMTLINVFLNVLYYNYLECKYNLSAVKIYQ